MVVMNYLNKTRNYYVENVELSFVFPSSQLSTKIDWQIMRLIAFPNMQSIPNRRAKRVTFHCKSMQSP